MKKHELSLIGKAEDLYKMKKKNPAAFIEAKPKRGPGRPMAPQNILKAFRKIRANLNKPEQLELLERQLTEGGRGMKLREFRYYPHPGSPYGNPYDKDFVQAREKDRKHGLIKAGLVGAGLLGGGALLGKGLYKAGVSASSLRAIKAEDELGALKREVDVLRKAKPTDITPAPKGRPAKPVVPVMQSPPPPQAAPQPSPSRADNAILSAGRNKKSVAPTVQVVENLQKSGALSSADAAAEVGEALAAKSPRKLTPRQEQLKKRAERVARAAQANKAPAPAPVASPKPAPGKTEIPQAKKPASALKASSATSEEFVEIPGVGKFPNTGTPEQNAAFRKKMNEAHASGGFKGKAAADVVDEIRQSLNQKSDFPPGLSDQLRAAGRENNPQPKGRKKAKGDGEFASGGRNNDKVKQDTESLADAFAEEMGGSARPAKKSGKSAKKSGKSAKSGGKKSAEPTLKGLLPDLSNLKPEQRRALQAKARARRKNRQNNLAAILRGMKAFNFQTDEGGIPFTGKVAKDRFIKKLRDEDLDRRDANILRAGGAGALAGLLLKGKLSAGKRALIGAGLGGSGVIATRMATNNTRDIYGERSRGAKRAELTPVVAGLGAAGYFASRRLRGLSAKLRGVKEFSILNKISSLTGLAQIKSGRKALAQAKYNRRLRDGYRAEAAHHNKFPYKDSELQYKIESGMRGRAIEHDTYAKHDVRDARKLINEGVRRRNISIGVGAGVAGSAGAGYLATRKKDQKQLAAKFFEKKERGLNPYVGAALSGFGSGAALGSLALLRRGATFRSAAKTAGKLGLASAGIVGGGALLGSKIIGNPKDNESAPFTKRAAIGGAIVGSGAGLAGALLLRKTKGGARALVSASKKTEPFSRSAMWLRKTPLAGAAGIGAVGGALYGGGMGADEGQQVDSIRNIKKDLKKNLSAKLRLRLFGRSDQARWDAPGSEYDSRFANVPVGWVTGRKMYGRSYRNEQGNLVRDAWEPTSPQLWNAVARDAKKHRVTVQRSGRLSRDVVDEIRGAPRQRDASGRIKKREWEKSWFQNKATEVGMTAAGIGGLAAARYAHNNPDTKIGKAYSNAKVSVRATKSNLADIGANILKGATALTGKRLSAKLSRLRELDAIAEYEGWDVRDPRGRSARVFAPGSRRRERRQKEWHEKTDNERKLWKAGLVASALGGAGVLLVGQRLASGKSLIPSRFIKKPIDPSVFAERPPSAKEADKILKKFNK